MKTNKNVNELQHNALKINIEESIKEIGLIDKQEYNPITWKNGEIRIVKCKSFNHKQIWDNGQLIDKISSVDFDDLKYSTKIRIGVLYNNVLIQLNHGNVKIGTILALKCIGHSNSYPKFTIFVYDLQTKKWIKSKEAFEKNNTPEFPNEFEISEQ